MSKAVPNKNAGFIILLTSIFTFFFFGEIRLIAAFIRLMDYNNGFSFSSLFFIILSFLWIGAQFPQEKFLFYGRILTLIFIKDLVAARFPDFFVTKKILTMRRFVTKKKEATKKMNRKPDDRGEDSMGRRVHH